MGKYDGYDPNKHRASLSYIFGFSDKPYKSRDEPSTNNPKATTYTAIASDPAKVLEWVASDGRKNKLNGKGKPRASMSEKESSSKAGSTTSKKSKSAKSGETKSYNSISGGWNNESWDNDESDKNKTNNWDIGANDNGNMPWNNDTKTNYGAAGANASSTTTNNANADASKDQDKAGDRENTRKDASNNDKEAKNRKDTGKDNNKESDSSKLNDTTGVTSPHKFTEDQDKKIRDLKNAEIGISWKDIAKQIGENKNEAQCKERWNEIKPKDWKSPIKDKGQGKEKKGKQENNKQNGGDKKEDTNKSVNDDGGIFGILDMVDGENDNAGKKDETNKNRDGSKEKTKTASVTGSNHSIPYQTTLTPDNTFSLHDLKLLATIANQDNATAFNRIADRFWDKTDRRIHPEIFEKKLTGHCAREERQKAKEQEREARREKEKAKRRSYEEEVRRQKEWDRQRAKEREEEMTRRARKAHFGSLH